MRLQYLDGARIDGLAVDPTGRNAMALFTHRPARRAACQRFACSAPLAKAWPQALPLPFGQEVVALGRRIELVETGYGMGGAAALVTRAGQRAFVVGPTTTSLVARSADLLILEAPHIASRDRSWLRAAARPGGPQVLVAPDGAALEAAAAELRAAGVPFRGPRWVGGRSAKARVRLTLRGAGLKIDMRPQADEGFLADFARKVGAREIWLHGPRARDMAVMIAHSGVPTRVLGLVPLPNALRKSQVRGLVHLSCTPQAFRPPVDRGGS